MDHSLALRETAKCEPLKAVWAQVAHLAMQKISSPHYCRIACYTMNVLLNIGLVAYGDFGDSIALAISSASLNGPALFCDTAVELWLKMSSLRAQSQPGIRGMNGFHHMLEWLSAKWMPSKTITASLVDQILSPFR